MAEHRSISLEELQRKLKDGSASIIPLAEVQRREEAERKKREATRQMPPAPKILTEIPEATYAAIVERERQRAMPNILQEQTLWYESRGLPQWATAARALQDRWLAEPALRQIIEHKREAGHLIVAMPGRNALLQTAALTMQNLIPPRRRK